VTLQDSALREAGADEDRRLLQAMAAGSADALGALYDRHAAIVFSIARRMLGRVEDAEEVVQDVFAQVWRQAAKYDSARASVAGWIVMLARTRAIDRLRAREARPDTGSSTPAETLPLPSPAPSPDAIVLASDDVRRVREAMAQLPEPQRGLLDLACYEGLSHTQIAARTGVPLGTVKARLRQAMIALREALTPPARITS
jgi:RNA polymerase sigma-70 factor (ECF subfamily)